jgi:hypothetical protein
MSRHFMSPTHLINYVWYYSSVQFVILSIDALCGQRKTLQHMLELEQMCPDQFGVSPVLVN